MGDNRVFNDMQSNRRNDALRRSYSGMNGVAPMHCTPAMAFIPFQSDIQTYSCSKALECGTIFPVLDKPFLGGRCK